MIACYKLDLSKCARNDSSSPTTHPDTPLRRYAAVLLALVLLKIGWIWALRLDGETLLQGGYRDDLLARRAYLVARLDQAAGPDAMPDWIPPQFRGEWALVTYSMSAAAVTNIAFLVPETREEACGLVAGWIETVIGRSPSGRRTLRRRGCKRRIRTCG